MFFHFFNIFFFEFVSLLKLKKNYIFFIFFDNFFDIYSNFNFFNNFINFKFFFIFILNFYLFKYNFNLNKFEFNTNPFSKSLIFDLVYLDLNPLLCLSKSYDIILNGLEIGGGSVRNNKNFIQNKIFSIVFNIFEISYNFKFFLNFLKKSPPQHCGCAFGLDRIIFIFLGLKNLKKISIFNEFCFKSPNFLI
ncbi:MAG: amino acid--tRNA ligase-related protein [Candidatus Nasuia deltocephalinicola]